MTAPMYRRWGSILVAMLLVACAQPAAEPTHTDTTEVHWGYTGEVGPEHWGALSEDFALCATGQAQTPIDIVPSTQADVVDPVFTYQAGTSEVINNGHTIQLKADSGNQMTVDGTDYTLLQMHFHTPSEHAIAGERLPAEMHFVHQAADGTLAVVAVLMQTGDAPNQAWQTMVDVLGTTPDAPATTTVDWQTLLPSDTATYRYEGSLTTPPCTEGVQWYVMQTPVVLSAAQIQAFEATYAGNARPLQDVYNREIVQDTSR